MYCLHYVERPQPDNRLSSMFHELVFLGYNSQFAFYSYSWRILQPYVAATVRKSCDAIFSSIGASRIKTFIKIDAFYKPLSLWV